MPAREQVIDVMQFVPTAAGGDPLGHFATVVSPPNGSIQPALAAQGVVCSFLIVVLPALPTARAY